MLYQYRFGSLGLGLNQQIAMFGLIGDDMYNPDHVKAKIKEIDSKFDLVKVHFKRGSPLRNGIFAKLFPDYDT